MIDDHLKTKKANSHLNIVTKKQKLSMSKRSQVTIFIIIAIIIVAGIGVYFLFRENLTLGNVPKEFKDVYSYYTSCIEEETMNGAKLLGEGGGRIEETEFSPGSEYMPFSSHLGFMGYGIPYWHYISGNGVSKEQVPSKEKMQSELNNFVQEGLLNCGFSDFEEKGYEISVANAKVNSLIKDNSISVNVKQNINIKFGDKTWSGKTHSVNVNSNLGKFYDLALKIYKNEKSEMFLENYGVDILRLYAPVDGSEISCSSKIWNIKDVHENLTEALESNIPAVKIKGDYYTLANNDNKYFVRDIGEKTDYSVNFMYSRYWPMKLEVWPSEDGLMKADPVGLEQGLGILGFCYVPYHFVYDFAYPVLVQVYSKDEVFQFPVVVLIDKNEPRKSANASSMPSVIPELCLKEHKNTQMNIYTYNTNLEPVEAEIKFKCFDTTCNIGKTSIENGEAVLTDKFPQCGNAFIIASAEGYETKKELASTVNSGNVDIILSKKYKLDMEVRKTGSQIDSYAVVTFEKENGTTISLSYPEQKEVELTEGQYKIKVYVYSNTSIHLKGSVNQKCIDVPRSGMFGIFGVTEEKCFNLEIPDQTVEIAISGGGVQNYYIAESELKESKKMIIDTQSFGVPSSVEELQKNYNNAEASDLDVYFE